jgi:oligosaccharyltransferase complex subunit beta
VYELQVSEWQTDKWAPFSAFDLQFEAVMLDPYIRSTLVQASSSLEHTQ